MNPIVASIFETPSIITNL